MSLIRVTPAELRSLSSRCRGEAGRIDQVRHGVGQAIAGADWTSPAAQRFRANWDTDFRPALDKLSVALNELGTSAARMADNYEATEAALR
jgi:WXG100 family type VII secretion target